MKSIFVYGKKGSKWSIEWANAHQLTYVGINTKEEAIKKATQMLKERGGGLLTVIVDSEIAETHLV